MFELEKEIREYLLIYTYNMRKKRNKTKIDKKVQK